MLAISAEARQRLLNTICLIIGTIMFYRGITDFVVWEGEPVRKLLGLIFFGGVLGIYLMYRRLRFGFWLFAVLDFSVGIIFIFILEDVWHHHVWPHILFAAVFVPFYGDFRTLRLSLPEIANRLVARHPWITRLIRRIGPVQRLVNRLIINGVTSSTPQRPLPLSLWTPDTQPLGARDPGTYRTFVSWPWSRRALLHGPASRADERGRRGRPARRRELRAYLQTRRDDGVSAHKCLHLTECVRSAPGKQSNNFGQHVSAAVVDVIARRIGHLIRQDLQQAREGRSMR